jgi:hypothetical protein
MVAYTEEHAAAYPQEERWRDDCGPREKLFLQALIQSAVIFHHIEIGRRGAARRMYGMAREKFARLGSERFMSLDVREYVEGLARSLRWLEESEDPREAVAPADLAAPPMRLLPGVMEYD